MLNTFAKFVQFFFFLQMYIIFATFCVYAMYAYITSRKYTYKDPLKKKKRERGNSLNQKYCS